MKKTYIFSILFLTYTINAFAASIPWWEQPTVCKVDSTECYTTMGTGYDKELWDNDIGCWGMKLICPEALITEEFAPVAMGRNDISKGTNINSDFDVTMLNGDCFGVRKTSGNGAMASVNGQYVKVWCNGILNNVDEYLENGEITYGVQPTCEELAEYGYVGTVNGKCYGKYYDPAKYYIECDGTDIMPSRIIVLNGADFNTNSNEAPSDTSAASKIFDSMQSISESQRKTYFKNE